MATIAPGAVANVPANSVPFEEAQTGRVSRQWYLFFNGIYSAINQKIGLSTVNVYTKNQSTGITPLIDAATVAFDVSQSNNFSLLCTAGVGATRKLGNATNATAGMVVNLWVTQSSAGSNALTFDTSYKFAAAAVPTASTTPNTVDFYSMSFNGSVWVVVQTKGLG